MWLLNATKISLDMNFVTFNTTEFNTDQSSFCVLDHLVWFGQKAMDLVWPKGNGFGLAKSIGIICKVCP